MNSGFRLRRSADFQRVRAERRAVADRLLRVQARPNGLEHPRFGISAGRHLGNAVDRNRVRRRLREAARGELAGLFPYDLVLIPTREAVASPYSALAGSLHHHLERLGVSAS